MPEKKISINPQRNLAAQPALLHQNIREARRFLQAHFDAHEWYGECTDFAIKKRTGNYHSQISFGVYIPWINEKTMENVVAILLMRKLRKKFTLVGSQDAE